MLTKILKWAGISVAVIIGLLVIFVVYVQTALPNIEVQDIKIDVTPERIARGHYLANNVMGCVDCHSKRQRDIISFPKDENSIGANAIPYDEKMGFTLGALYPSNLTPFNLKNWSDGEIYRAIVNGVGKDNHVLFPIMPYMNFCKLDKEDIYSVIAYLRTLEPVKSIPHHSHVDFPMSMIMKLAFPQEPQHQKIPDKNNRVEYGKYMITASSCIDCHTPYDKDGKPILDSAFTGGFELTTVSGKKILTANITPDKETGIGNWTEDFFISRFAMYRDSTMKTRKLANEDIHSEMPWSTYAGMKDEDLGAIYTFLMSLKPVKKQIKKGNY